MVRRSVSGETSGKKMTPLWQVKVGGGNVNGRRLQDVTGKRDA